MPSLVLVSMNLDSRFSLLNWCLGIFCRGNYVSTAEPWWLLLPWWFWSALWPTALYSGNIESPSHQGPYPLSLHLRRLKLAWASLEKTLPFNPILSWFSTIWSGFLFISLILLFKKVFWLFWVFVGMWGLFFSCDKQELLSSCGAQTSHCGSFSCYRVWALECELNICGSRG